MCSPDWPGSHLHAAASRGVGLMACTIHHTRPITVSSVEQSLKLFLIKEGLKLISLFFLLGML